MKRKGMGSAQGDTSGGRIKFWEEKKAYKRNKGGKVTCGLN